MNSLIISIFATLAFTSASPSGLGWGGLGWGLGPIAAPGIIGPIGAPIGPIASIGAIASPIVAPIAAPIVAPVGATAITNGGGIVGVSGAGAVVKAPPTAPVVIEGPAGTGTIAANGLWGPTLAGVAH